MEEKGEADVRLGEHPEGNGLPPRKAVEGLLLEEKRRTKGRKTLRLRGKVKPEADSLAKR